LEERYDRDKIARILKRKPITKEIHELATTLYDERFRQGMVSDLVACAKHAAFQYDNVAAMGFSMGGRLSLRLASRYHKLKSCITFCGESPKRQELERITAPILAIQAGKDDFMNHGVPKFVREALELKKSLTLKIYPNAKHEFFDETNTRDFDYRDARDSWRVTENFLKVTLVTN